MIKWKPIQGYEKLYCISNTCVVKALPYKRQRKSGEAFYNSVVLKNGVSSKGYFRVNLYKNNKYKTFLIHRLVALHFISNPYRLPEVNHLDGVKSNNNKSNLEWSTHKNNSVHAVKNNLFKCGINHPKAILNLDSIRLIVLDRQNGMKTRDIITKYDIPSQIIYRFLRGESYLAYQQNQKQTIKNQ